MKPLDHMQLTVMTLINEEGQPLTLFDLMLRIEEGTTVGIVGLAVQALLEGGFLVPMCSSSPAPTQAYARAHAFVLSDLRAKLLPSRDPVREAHEWTATQGLRGRYRRPTEQGADLDWES